MLLGKSSFRLPAFWFADQEAATQIWGSKFRQAAPGGPWVLSRNPRIPASHPSRSIRVDFVHKSPVAGPPPVVTGVDLQLVYWCATGVQLVCNWRATDVSGVSKTPRPTVPFAEPQERPTLSSSHTCPVSDFQRFAPVGPWLVLSRWPWPGKTLMGQLGMGQNEATSPCVHLGLHLAMGHNLCLHFGGINTQVPPILMFTKGTGF